jgi:hypothetical protein
MKNTKIQFIAVFLISIATIAYEIAVMRSFAIGSWSNFGSMIISIALLGIGLAGTLLTFIHNRVKKNPEAWLAWAAFFFLPSMVLAHIVSQYIPFNPLFIVTDFKQFIWIGMYYLLYSIPFFFGALFIGVAFIVLSGQIHKLYFWNMLGSGLGGFFILVSMYFLPTNFLLIPIMFLTLIGILLCFQSLSPDNSNFFVKNHFIFNIGSFVICFMAIIFLGKIQVSDYKPISYAQNFPDAQLVYNSYGPTGEMHVYDSSYFHFAPGLSDNAAFNLTKIPQKAFMGLYMDGEGPIGVMRYLDKEEEQYIDYLPMTAPYLLLDKPRVLVAYAGGGTSLFTALHHQASFIRVVEPNYKIIDLLKNEPLFKRFNNNLLTKPQLAITTNEPRSYCAATREAFDLVEISLIDGIGLSQTGGYPVTENYTYTTEAINDYLSCLSDKGMLSITVWNRLDPPRNVPKLLTTAVSALKNLKIAKPENQIYMFQLMLSTATLLIKKSPFTAQEIAGLNDFCDMMSFEVCHYPGMEERPLDFNSILKQYRNQFVLEKELPSTNHTPDKLAKGLIDSISAPHGLDNPLLAGEATLSAEDQNLDQISDRKPLNSRNNILPAGDLYHFVLRWLCSGKEDQLYKDYIFDIRPARDDRPYYTGYLKPEKLTAFLPKINSISEEWGYIMLLCTLIQSLFFGLLIILLPMFSCWRELFKGRKGTGGVILYYACLGLGYMLIEIFLIQKFVYFLADPIISVSSVITTMLVASGLGSVTAGHLTGSRYKINHKLLIRIAAGVIALCIMVYIFLIPSWLQLGLGLPFLAKIGLTILFIFPIAFFLGMPFPLGLSNLTNSRPSLLPWAWGMNGALSVTGSVIARLFSIANGFTFVLIFAVILYGLAALVFAANTRKMEQPG